MAHLIDRHLIERANAAVLLSMVWAALAACVIGAVIYDIASWLGGYPRTFFVSVLSFNT